MKLPSALLSRRQLQLATSTHPKSSTGEPVTIIRSENLPKIVRDFRSKKVMPKPKKMGRPKLPKGHAKGIIRPVRFTEAELRLFKKIARRASIKRCPVGFVTY